MHALRLALSVVSNKGWVYLGHFFGNQAKGGRPGSINLFLVAVTDGFELIKCFAGVLHRFDVFFVASR